jgi:hypothetical protein
MKYTLPPKLAEIRRTLACSHNRRVLFLIVIYFVFVLAGALAARPHSAGNWVLAVGTILAVMGIIYVIRLGKKQSIALGFVCPLCGGALYDFGSNRLGRRGECPCCKQFIIERLNEESPSLCTSESAARALASSRSDAFLRRFARYCATAIGIVILVMIAFGEYCRSKHPQFGGASPLAIDVRVTRKYSSTNLYRISITNRAACDSILNELRQAQFVLDRNKAIGEIVIRYDNGKADIVLIMPRLRSANSDIYFGGAFRLPRERFYQVLKDGGVDISKL